MAPWRAPAASCIAAALALCLCLAPAAARKDKEHPDDGRFVEPQGHMLLLNGACSRRRSSCGRRRRALPLTRDAYAGDSYVVARELKDAPTTALTFEAWVRSTDECNDGTLLSYSVDPEKCAALQRCCARARAAR